MIKKKRYRFNTFKRVFLNFASKNLKIRKKNGKKTLPFKRVFLSILKKFEEKVKNFKKIMNHFIFFCVKLVTKDIFFFKL